MDVSRRFMVLLVLVVSLSTSLYGDVPNYVRDACQNTLYPHRCESSMGSYNFKLVSRPNDMVMPSVRVSMVHAKAAHKMVTDLPKHYALNTQELAAWKDCVELMDNTLAHLNVCVSQEKPSGLYFSAVLSDLDTCLAGFTDLRCRKSPFRNQLGSAAVNVSELVSNSLALYARYVNNITAPTTPKNGRKLLYAEDDEGFPEWMSAGERRLLQTVTPAQANLVVAKDGSGKFNSINAALGSIPKNSGKRFVVYVKAGVYKENVEITNKMINVVFIGDGKDRTVVTGNKNVQDGTTTFRSATFAVAGNGFMARDMTFENTAGPAKHQAVALRINADKTAVYRCSMKGYQDTLYVHSLRQFYREIDVYGTVDFIFGNAAAVIQNSNIYARNPMSGQFNTLTAQGRGDPNENTGIVIHNCHIAAAGAVSAKTYLGRPWRQYSRTVIMGSTIDALIDPAGWSIWDGNFALDTLYYAEYNNRGAGASTARRVKWKGYHVITSAATALQFSAGQFIAGGSWIPAFGVPFTSGL